MNDTTQRAMRLCDEFARVAEAQLKNDDVALQRIESKMAEIQPRVDAAMQRLVNAVMMGQQMNKTDKEIQNDPAFIDASFEMIDLLAVIMVTGLGEFNSKALVSDALKKDKEVIALLQKRAPIMAKLCA